MAEHYWSFSVSSGVQEYMMDCLLCGHASSTVKMYLLLNEKQQVAQSTEIPIPRHVNLDASRLDSLVNSAAYTGGGVTNEDDGEWD